MVKFDYYSKTGRQFGETDRLVTFTQFELVIRLKYYINYTLLLAVALLWPGLSAAHHCPGPNCPYSNIASASKFCRFSSTPGSFVIQGTDKYVHWTAYYQGPAPGSPAEPCGVQFILRKTVGTTKTDIILSSNVTGSYPKTGTQLLSAGTYEILVADSRMGSGSYQIEYNPTSSGDPHITTVNGVRYDFQAAGEFILLRQTNGLEIQVRHTPVATKGATCVSINTAVAMRVGAHRVTYQPDLSSSDPDANVLQLGIGALQLRVDGALTDPGGRGIDFGNHGRITRTSAPGGLRIDFPDGSSLFVMPGWWAEQRKWYLNLSIAPASDQGLGIAGAIVPGTWLPALPDGSSMGPQPNSSHDRYVDLNQKFADAWRVTGANSLFDYASGTSTSTFTNRSWPSENPPCNIPGTTPSEPIAENLAKVICLGVTGGEYANCVYDVMVTGNPGFAATYALHQCVLADAVSDTIPSPCEPPSSRWKWILLGLLLGLVIGLLIFLLRRKWAKP